MKKRCNDQKHGSYKNYGGRGIRYCDRWESFVNFLADMGIKPLGTSIDRRDNNGNYTPKHCRWATRNQQNNNSRHNRLITIGGKTKNMTQWCNHYGIKLHTVYRRLRIGMSERQALTEPVTPNGIHLRQNPRPL